MNTKVSSIYKETLRQLAEIYGESEGRSLANILFEDLLGINKVKRITSPDLELSPEQQDLCESAIKRLLNHEPIQQISGFTYFLGHQFKVNKQTLIPRPETEELVELILRENTQTSLKVLDIGTGSGCIAIPLALGLKDSEITSWDVSDEILKVADENAHSLGVKVSFEKVDVLSYSGDDKFDIIVSNPPYIPANEKSVMEENVLKYEPEMALFVPDEDPLLFYRKIGELGKRNLTKSGKLYFEIHEKYGEAVKKLLENQGYKKVRIFKDMQGKDRMVRAFI